MSSPHQEVVLTHHPVIRHRGSGKRFRCLAADGGYESYPVPHEGMIHCAVCGNELGPIGSLVITYHNNGQVYLAFF